MAIASSNHFWRQGYRRWADFSLVGVAMHRLIFSSIAAVLTFSPQAYSSDFTAAVSAPVNCSSLQFNSSKLPEPRGLPPTSCGEDSSALDARSSRVGLRDDLKYLELAVFDLFSSKEPPTSCHIEPRIVWAHAAEFKHGSSALQKVFKKNCIRWFWRNC